LSREVFEEEAISQYDELRNEFLNLAINRFTWKNLPNGLTSEQLELLLINKGQLMYFKDKNLGELLLPCFATSDLNPYGLPTNYTVNGENGKYNETIDIDEGAILKNNPLGKPDISKIETYAKRIDNVEMTQDVNLFQQCMPKLILADEDSKLTAKGIIEKIRKFRFVIFGKKSLVNNVTTSDVLDTSSPYIIDKLQQQKVEYKNELLTYLGINTVNIMKKERVNTEEVNANNDYTATNIDLMYDLRVKFCEEVKQKFGKDIQVEKREVEESGTNDDNPGGDIGE
jgi:hypothetical protein